MKFSLLVLSSLSILSKNVLSFTQPSFFLHHHHRHVNSKHKQQQLLQEGRKFKNVNVLHQHQDDYLNNNNEEDDDGNNIYYDDFGDSFIGSGGGNTPQGNNIPSSSSSLRQQSKEDVQWMSKLNARVSTIQSNELQRQEKLTKNWSTGNWNVRGFALDKYDPITNDGNDDGNENVFVDDDDDNGERSGVVSPFEEGGEKRTLDGRNDAAAPSFPTSFVNYDASSSSSSSSQSQSNENSNSKNSQSSSSSSSNKSIYISKISTDQSNHNPNIIAVGRTDGSVVLVKLGTRYLTRFTSVPKIVYDEDKWASSSSSSSGSSDDEEGKNEESGPSLSIESELMDSEELAKKLFEEGNNGGGDGAFQYGPDSSAFTSENYNNNNDNDARTNKSPYDYSAQDNEELGLAAPQEEEEEKKYQKQWKEGTPFQILHQFRATHEEKQQQQQRQQQHESITSLLYHDDVIYTSGGVNGDVKIWSIPENVFYAGDDDDDDDDGENKNKKKVMIPLKTLHRAHSNQVVCLKTLSSSAAQKSEYDDDEEEEEKDDDLLLSASLDGSFALWDLRTGDLVHRCQLTDEYGEETVSIQCADVDRQRQKEEAGSGAAAGGGNTGDVMYFGLNTGHVVGYTVRDVIASAGLWDDDTCPVPSCTFLAHDTSGKEGLSGGVGGDGGGMEDDFIDTVSEGGRIMMMKGVTSILCAGKGLMSSGGGGGGGMSQQTSSIVTGGADGIVKQWEIMARKVPPQSSSPSTTPEIKLEHWPRLATQRMRQCAHLFEGHYGPITALASIDTTKVLTAGVDGTVRVWNRSEGKELFRMDGFTSRISSLCLEEDRLITDGMEEYVCLHDFEADEIEEGTDYELEDDW